MFTVLPSVLMVVVVMVEGKVVQVTRPQSLTKVTGLAVPRLDPSSGLAVEIRLENINNNSRVFFTAVFSGEIHTWSLDSGRERVVTKYLCTQTHTDTQVLST